MIYPDRYSKEPRKRMAYCEACDLISVYGLERRQLNYKAHHLCRTEMKEIWATAEKDMSGNSTYDRIYTGRKSR